MKLLIDTHVFIWWDNQDERLSNRVRDALSNPENEIFLSLASVWEMQIKFQLGKLTLRNELPVILEEQERTNRIFILPPNRQDVFYHGRLPLHHRDPFDRMILAQALRGSFHLVTHDSCMGLYDAPIFW